MYVWTAVVATALLLLVAALAEVPTYRFAPAFLVPLLWAAYLLRGRLHLHPLHYALFCAALLLHSLGAFGMYQRGVAGVSFDVYVHVYFGFVAALMVRRYLRRSLPLGPWALAVGTVLLVIGGGAAHEIMEYASYLMLGEERGMLKPSSSYAFDTQRDLLSNLAGSAVALLVEAVRGMIGATNSRRHMASARIVSSGLLVLMVAGGCASQSFVEQAAPREASSAQFDVPPKQMVQLVQTVLANPPTSLQIEQQDKGQLTTSWQRFPGDWHIARRWQERTRYVIFISPDWDEPTARSHVRVEEQTEQRATEGQIWQAAPELRRPQRAAEVLQRIAAQARSAPAGR